MITDENVEKPHAVTVAESLAGESINVDLAVVEPGETTKSIERSAALWQMMLELGSDRATDSRRRA